MASKYLSHPRCRASIDGKTFFFEDFNASLNVTNQMVQPGGQDTVDEFVPTTRMASWSVGRAFRVGAGTTPVGEGLIPSGRGDIGTRVASLANFSGKNIVIEDIVTGAPIATLVNIATDSVALNVSRGSIAQQPISGRAANLLLQDEL